MAVHPCTLSLDVSSSLHACCTVPFSKNLNRDLFYPSEYPFLFRSKEKTFVLEAMDVSLPTFCGHVPYARLVQQIHRLVQQSVSFSVSSVEAVIAADCSNAVKSPIHSNNVHELDKNDDPLNRRSNSSVRQDPSHVNGSSYLSLAQSFAHFTVRLMHTSILITIYPPLLIGPRPRSCKQQPLLRRDRKP